MTYCHSTFDSITFDGKTHIKILMCIYRRIYFKIDIHNYMVILNFSLKKFDATSPEFCSMY